MPGWAGDRREGARQAGSVLEPEPPCSPVGHLGELRPLEIGRQPPDLLPGRRHGARHVSPSRAAAGSERGRRRAGPASASSAAPRHGGAPARARPSERNGTRASYGKGNKERRPRSGMAPAAGSRRGGHGSGFPLLRPGQGYRSWAWALSPAFSVNSAVCEGSSVAT